MSGAAAREAIAKVRTDLRKIGTALEQVGQDPALTEARRTRLGSLADQHVAGLSHALKHWADGLDAQQTADLRKRPATTAMP